MSEAAEWYESQQSGLGKRFLDEVLRACQHISENPEMYPSVNRRTRRAIIHKFPFGIFFRLERIGVVVFAVARQQGSQNVDGTNITNRSAGFVEIKSSSSQPPCTCEEVDLGFRWLTVHLKRLSVVAVKPSVFKK